MFLIFTDQFKQLFFPGLNGILAPSCLSMGLNWVKLGYIRVQLQTGLSLEVFSRVTSRVQQLLFTGLN